MAGKTVSKMIIRPHRMRRVQRRDLLLPAFRGLCVRLLDKTMSCAKTDEPIEILFGAWIQVRPRDHTSLLRGQGGRGSFEGFPPNWKAL